MSVQSLAKPQNNRIQVVDALRGFALLGIVFVHMVEQYLGGSAPDSFYVAAYVTPLDGWINTFIEIALRGKFFSLFALLFGMSFYIQMHSAQTKGDDFQQRFLWRLGILLVIGYLHSLFYRGDILTVYALVGVILLFMRKLPRWVVYITIFLIFSGMVRALVFVLFNGEPLSAWGVLAYDTPEGREYFSRVSEGSLLDVMAINAWYGHLWNSEIQLNFYARAYITLGYFLIGWLIAQTGILRRFQDYRKQTWLSLVGAVLLTPALIILAVHFFENMGDTGISSWNGMLAMNIWALSDMSMLLIYVSLFLLIFQTKRGFGLLNLLSPYGRTALSAYVSQSILGTFVFYHYGLGLIGSVSNTQAALLGIAMMLMQIALSHLWLRYFHYGPLEWLWRCGTRREWVVNKRHSTKLSISQS
jgi:uncharacterized protein